MSVYCICACEYVYTFVYTCVCVYKGVCLCVHLHAWVPHLRQAGGEKRKHLARCLCVGVERSEIDGTKRMNLKAVGLSMSAMCKPLYMTLK